MKMLVSFVAVLGFFFVTIPSVAAESKSAAEAFLRASVHLVGAGELSKIVR